MDISQYKNVKVLNHPLLTHKITKLRNVKTKTNDFRQLVKEIAVIEADLARRAFGMDPEGADYRACQAYGPLFKK